MDRQNGSKNKKSDASKQGSQMKKGTDSNRSTSSSKGNGSQCKDEMDNCDYKN